MRSVDTQQGALEAAAAVMGHAQRVLDIPQLAAITTAANLRSGRVLSRLGLRLENEAYTTPDGELLKLYVFRRDSEAQTAR